MDCHTSLRKYDVGRGRLVVKVMNFELTCHKFESSTPENPPGRVKMHVEQSSNALLWVWCGSWKKGYHLKCRPRKLTMFPNYEVRRQEPSSS
ncbi:hypothetical protein TNCV_4466711 [Trichonephila clavipes]|nr:hypothetical protein TNCV_4466711 [Trichonephila clavipes]